VQFRVVESLQKFTSNLGVDISVKEINIQSLTDMNTLESIVSPYESALFQYTSETFQVSNATKDNIRLSQAPGALVDTTRNIRKAFAGIFNNGIKTLRSASYVVAKEVQNTYSSQIQTFFLLRIMLVSLIVIFLILVTMIYLIPKIFQIMRTTKLVLVLFGKIKREDIVKLADKCQKFQEELEIEISRNDGSRAPNDEKVEDDKNENNKNPEDKPVTGTIVPKGGAVEEEPFDNKTEKPNPSSLGKSKKPETAEKEPVLDKLKEGSQGLGVGDEKEQLNKLKSDANGGLEKQKPKKKGTVRDKSQSSLVNKKKEERQMEEEEEVIAMKLLNSKHRVNQKIILVFIIIALLLIAPQIALILTENSLIMEKQILLSHIGRVASLQSDIKYSMLFSIESFANLSSLKLLPEDFSANANEYYTRESYDSFSTVQDNIKNLPTAFNAYKDLYGRINYKNACDAVPVLMSDGRLRVT
jgi:hypothetical protein